MRHSLLALMLVAMTVTGCGTWSRLTGKDREAQEQALRLEQMQQKCQRFADSCAGQVLETVGSMKKQTSEPQAYNRLLARQITQLDAAYTIATWRAKNPMVALVGFVHFAELAESAGMSPEARRKPGSLFGLIGLDPLAELDLAVRQIEQSRLLAERAIFYMQRVPYVLDLRTERIVSQATLSPQIERANASLERASHAMARGDG